MNKMNLDFMMAKYSSKNTVLRAIARDTLNFLLKNIDNNRIKSILLTGSVANGEGTVIRCKSFVMTSDFDFVIFLDFPYYLRNRINLRNLSQEMSEKLHKSAIHTHICFLPSTNALRIGARLMNPNIYEYEFAFASKCIFGKTLSFNKTTRPSKNDALELLFTVVSDLLFSKFKNVSKIEESYIYAKRALTALNSILISNGLFAETYEKRMKIAKKYASEGLIPLNQDEMKTLEMFNEYKISGSFKHLLDALACKKVEDLVQFQKSFLEKLTIKILYYELANLLNWSTDANLTDDGSIQSLAHSFPKLLTEYAKHSKGSLPSRIMGVIACLFWSLVRFQEKRELFTSFIFHKQSPKVILNVLVTLSFIYGGDVSIANILKEAFPWINLNNGPAIRKMFSLWRTAEQSMKLG